MDERGKNQQYACEEQNRQRQIEYPESFDHVIFCATNILASQKRIVTARPHTIKVVLVLSNKVGMTTDPKEIWAVSANIEEILSRAELLSLRFAGAKTNRMCCIKIS